MKSVAGKGDTQREKGGSSRSFRRVGTTTAILVVALALLTNTPALAAWSIGGGGTGAGRATSMPAGNKPTASVSGRTVTVSWSRSSLPNGTAVNDYLVRRFDTSGAEQATQNGCSGTVSALTCTESGVPSGAWQYSVTPKRSNWTGAASALSTAVNVGSPAMALSPATVTSLPATTTGSLSNFISGQVVTFRLDSTSGPILPSTMTPPTVAPNGTATASITVPAGTTNGTHTIYAMGNQGDVATAPLTVSVPVSRSITTAPYNVRDASSGAEANVSHQFAFAGDARTAALSAWGTAYSTTRFIDFNMSKPLPSGLGVSNAAFNFTFSSPGANQTCFYFDVRRASTGAVLGTHGDAANPVACSNSTTMVSTSTALSEVTTSAIANDLKIRVYGRNSASQASVEDLATVSGSTTATGAFTLYSASVGDAASGAAPVTYPWSLEAVDGTLLSTSTGWDTAFNNAKYLKLSYPSYLPSAASGVSATFIHSYRAGTATTTACYYFEVYSGATLLAAHGSPAAPVSCNSSNTTNVTDTVALPEVDSAAKANNIVIRIYAKNSGGKMNQRQTTHDAARVTIDFST